MPSFLVTSRRRRRGVCEYEEAHHGELETRMNTSKVKSGLKQLKIF
jgi:hypothetical protein